MKIDELRVELNNILCRCQSEIAKIRNTYDDDDDDDPVEKAVSRDTVLLLEEVIMFSRGARKLRDMGINILNYSVNEE